MGFRRREECYGCGRPEPTEYAASHKKLCRADCEYSPRRRIAWVARVLVPVIRASPTLGSDESSVSAPHGLERRHRVAEFLGIYRKASREGPEVWLRLSLADEEAMGPQGRGRIDKE